MIIKEKKDYTDLKIIFVLVIVFIALIFQEVAFFYVFFGLTGILFVLLAIVLYLDVKDMEEKYKDMPWSEVKKIFDEENES